MPRELPTIDFHRWITPRMIGRVVIEDRRNTLRQFLLRRSVRPVTLPLHDRRSVRHCRTDGLRCIFLS